MVRGHSQSGEGAKYFVDTCFLSRRGDVSEKRKEKKKNIRDKLTKSVTTLSAEKTKRHCNGNKLINFFHEQMNGVLLH